jgi:MGT family glycosyltransferase
MHIACCIAPFRGHVNPSLAVVSELARRSHRVSYATTAGFSGRVHDAGGNPVIYGGTMSPLADGPVVTGYAPDFARGHSGQLRELRAVLPALIAAFTGAEPDLVVCDPMCWAGRALAGRLRVPAINSITTMIGKARWSLGTMTGSISPADSRLPRLLAETSAVLARYETGLTAAQLLGIGDPLPSIVFHPRAFEPRGGEFGPDVHFVGPCLAGDRAGPDDNRRPQPPPGRPLVVVSLGTVFNRQPGLFRLCIDALAELSCHVVVALGGLDPSELGELPPNVQAYSPVRLTEVLRYASVMVGHGGMTSTMEALSLAIPVVAVPQMPEQHENARRLEELGLGLCLGPGQQTQENIRQAAISLMGDESIRPRLDWMRGEIELAPGAAAAAGLIEDAVRPAIPSR